MEIAGVPAQHQRGKGGVAKREIGVAGLEVEGPESPQAERAGELRNADANVDIHGDHAGHNGNRVGTAEDLPRRHVSERGNGGGVGLLDPDLGEAVEDGPVGAAFVMIGVGAEIEARNRWKDAAENIGVALDPRAGAELGGMGWTGGKDGGDAQKSQCRQQNARCRSSA